jgi:hypothetical protein
VLDPFGRWKGNRALLDDCARAAGGVIAKNGIQTMPPCSSFAQLWMDLRGRRPASKPH